MTQFETGLDIMEINILTMFFLKTDSNLCPIEGTKDFSKIWSGDLSFDPSSPIFKSGQDLIEINILTKFLKDSIKIVPSKLTTRFL